MSPDSRIGTGSARGGGPAPPDSRSLVLAFWVGPRLWRLAKTHDFYTTGDFLEFRYGAGGPQRHGADHLRRARSPFSPAN